MLSYSVTLSEFSRRENTRKCVKTANKALLGFSMIMFLFGILTLLFGSSFAFAVVAPKVLI